MNPLALLLGLFLFFASFSANGQDKIVLIQGDTLYGKVLSITKKEVRYEAEDSSIRLIQRARVRYIAFEDGSFVNQALPQKIQNTVTGEYYEIPFGTPIQCRLKNKNRVDKVFSNFEEHRMVFLDTVIAFADLKSIRMELEINSLDLKKRKTIGSIAILQAVLFGGLGLVSAGVNIAEGDTNDSGQNVLLAAVGGVLFLEGLRLKKNTKKVNVILGKRWKVADK